MGNGGSCRSTQQPPRPMDLLTLSSFAPVENWGDALDEALKAAKKASRHQDETQNNLEPPDLQTSKEQVQDNSGSLNLQTSEALRSSGAGTLGPGAYSFSEALVRRAPSCPRFSRLERFKDPTLSQAAPPPAVPALVQEMEQDWGPRQGCRVPGSEVTLGGRRVKPLRHPRLHLGLHAVARRAHQACHNLEVLHGHPRIGGHHLSWAKMMHTVIQAERCCSKLAPKICFTVVEALGRCPASLLDIHEAGHVAACRRRRQVLWQLRSKACRLRQSWRRAPASK